VSIEWKNQEVNYATQIHNDPYHSMRTEFILRLFPESVYSVVDFGCGEGFFSELMLRHGLAKKVIGLDPSPDLIGIAMKNKYLADIRDCEISIGNSSTLKSIDDSSVDLVIALNVLAYMSRDEEDEFYRESNRLLKPGGHLLVTHSNELFDMFTLNNLTVKFFDLNFGVKISQYLELSDQISVETYGIRENPLSYSMKLNRYGFRQERIDFFHHHDDLPRSSGTLVRNQVTPEFETRTEMTPENWREYFMSSTFGVLAEKT
jgi:ubiquinone/menaquinone biosynthesis C-methylase UbiE